MPVPFHLLEPGEDPTRFPSAYKRNKIRIPITLIAAGILFGFFLLFQFVIPKLKSGPGPVAAQIQEPADLITRTLRPTFTATHTSMIPMAMPTVPYRRPHDISNWNDLPIPTSIPTIAIPTATEIMPPTGVTYKKNEPLPSPTQSPTIMATYTPYPTYTRYPTYTPYPTPIPSPTPTATPWIIVITATFTPTPTLPITITATYTPTPTETATATETYAPTPTETATATETYAPTPTETATATETYTPTPTETISPISSSILALKMMTRLGRCSPKLAATSSNAASYAALTMAISLALAPNSSAHLMARALDRANAATTLNTSEEM